MLLSHLEAEIKKGIPNLVTAILEFLLSVSS